MRKTGPKPTRTQRPARSTPGRTTAALAQPGLAELQRKANDSSDTERLAGLEEAAQASLVARNLSAIQAQFGGGSPNAELPLQLMKTLPDSVV